MTRIVLLEPDRARRDNLKSLLRKHCGVFAVPRVHEALIAINRANPDVVVSALDLGAEGDIHGLGFGKLVRGGEGGKERVLVVYGVPEGKHPSDVKQEQIARDYDIDLYVGETLAADKLCPKILACLGVDGADVPEASKRRWKKREKPTVTHYGDQDSGVISLRDVLESDAVITARTRAIQDDDLEEDTWSGLFHKDVGVETLKEFFSKEIGMKPLESFADEDNPTWRELLSARVNTKNLKALLKKEIRFDRD